MPKSEKIFVDIVESILSQQLSNKAANTIITRVKNLLVKLSPGKVLSTKDLALRTCGISYAKIRYIKDLSNKVLDGTIQLNKLDKMTDQEIIDHLIVVKGIGKWTAEMMLMFTFNRPDVFPIDDLGIQNAMIKKYGLKRNKSLAVNMLKIAKEYIPHRTAFTKSLWKYLDNSKITK